MSKGYDSDTHKRDNLEEDIDFDFFGTPGRTEETSEFHVKHTSEKHPSKSQNHQPSHLENRRKSDSYTENQITKLETRMPCVEMEKEATGKQSRRSRSRSRSSDYSTDSEAEKERQMEQERKSKRPPSGKKKTSKDNVANGHSNGHKYSDDENSGRHSRHSSYSDHESDVKYKTSKSKENTTDGKSSKDNEYEEDFSGSESSYTSSYTSSDTESDVTDVSPLPSPLHTPKTSSQKGKDEATGITDEDIKRKLQQQLSKADSDTLDLKLLMQAMLELDKEQKQKSKKTTFMVPPPNYKQHDKQEKKNYTFSDDQAMDIDRENQRLMHKILKEARAAQTAKEERKKQKKQISAQSRMTSSAVNRQRTLTRIEQENRNILKRLEGAKATKSLARNSLLKQYNDQTLFGVSVAAAHYMPTRKRAKSTGSPYDVASLGSRTRSMTSLRSDDASLASHSNTASALSTQRSRPQSDHSPPKRPVSGYSPPKRPLSGHTPTRGKQTFVSSRPNWEPGW